jgi:peptidyl-prolyl cis-trans isomerase A (cyclophilin A)
MKTDSRGSGRLPWLLALALPLFVAACAGGSAELGEPPVPRSFLLEPESPEMNAAAPESFRVLFQTTSGDFTVEVTEAWAPEGARRLYNLVRAGYYDGVHFFRVIPSFVAQFGIHPDPDVSAAWRQSGITDDPVIVGNERGTLTFAMAGPDSRTVQLFINLTDNANLDQLGFAALGRVVEGMEVVDELYDGYGEGAPRGQGPDQGRMQFEGDSYISENFPLLDRIERARILPD